MARWAMLGLLVVVGWAFCCQGEAWAQQRGPLPPPVSMGPAPGSVPGPADLPARKPTSPAEAISSPEMSHYPYPMSVRPSADTKSLLQQKAAEQAAARFRRLTALKWFGFSNSRPVAGVDCIHGDYSPSWTSNHPHYPFRWVGVGPAWVASLPAIPSSRAESIQR